MIKRTPAGHIVVDTGRLEITFDGATGGVRRLVNTVTAQVIVAVEDPQPWRMTPQGTTWGLLPPMLPPTYERAVLGPVAFTATLGSDGASVDLAWTTDDPGLVVRVAARVEGTELSLVPTVDVADDALPPADFVYPILASPLPLRGEGTDDQLIWPAHSGWIMRRPLTQLPLSAPYPDGYLGASLQLTAYLTEGVGGLYLAAHDEHATWKSFDFSPTEWSITHETWDLRRGTTLEYGYPIVLAALTVGDWHEAADRYRAWALTAPWCDRGQQPNGPSADPARATWLRDEVGLAVWGGSSSLDWSPWYRFYQEVAGTPLHITAGWDWPAKRPHCLGREGWFPAKFHPANVAAWEGNYVTPYMTDLFVSSHAEDFHEVWEPNVVFPHSMFPFVPFSDPGPRWVDGSVSTPDPRVVTDVNFFMCPTTELQSSHHAWRDTVLMRDNELAGVCYDITSGNPLMGSRCWRTDHGHPPGRGRTIVQAYDTVNRRSKAEVDETTGKYLVQGVEVINENVIGSVDFYVSRACAGPIGALETWVPAPEEQPGTGRELIPLFQGVYHDVGPVQQDGWLTLAEDAGDLFYWIAARIVLQWGALLSLHYATNPPEKVPGHDGPAEVVNWDGGVLHFEDLPTADTGKLSFVRELARARTEMATEFVSYGRMLRRVPFTTGKVDLGFEQRFNNVPGLVNHGTWTVPEVVDGAWQAPDGRIGMLFVALGNDAPTTLTISADTARLWDLDLAGAEAIVSTAEGEIARTTVSATGHLELDIKLAARTVTSVVIDAPSEQS